VEFSESSVDDVVQSEYTVAQSFTSNNLVCTNLPLNLSRGSESSEVRMLQDFLYQKGLMSTLPTGFYGDQNKGSCENYTNVPHFFQRLEWRMSLHDLL
jgi:hypothetical protein